MYFERISKPDTETLKLFIQYRQSFKGHKTSAIKQLSKLINRCTAFYKVFYEGGDFEGCLFLYDIDDEAKTVEFGGFANRKANTTQAVNELIAFIKHHLPDYKIIADTKELSAKICLKRLGFTQNEKGEYCYG